MSTIVNVRIALLNDKNQTPIVKQKTINKDGIPFNIVRKNNFYNAYNQE